MSEERLVSLRNRWFTASIGITALLAVVFAAVGLVWLPRLYSGAPPGSLWDSICSAAGLVRRSVQREPVVQPAGPTTQVVLVPGMLGSASADAVGSGATLSLRCTMCHGARGVSQADTPNLAGQYPAVIYKQLADFKSGARPSAIMAPLVAPLSDQDMRDLAEFYAYLPRLPPYHTVGEPPRIVISGAPMRNIAPCGACHGGLDNKTGAAWLEGQPAAYLEAQLHAFAASARRNDIDAQMRNVARNMTPAEIAAAARYFASQP
ncbi:MAG TPA: c-type cytochrome [Stellaceae bacterium]